MVARRNSESSSNTESNIQAVPDEQETKINLDRQTGLEEKQLE